MRFKRFKRFKRFIIVEPLAKKRTSKTTKTPIKKINLESAYHTAISNPSSEFGVDDLEENVVDAESFMFSVSCALVIMEKNKVKNKKLK